MVIFNLIEIINGFYRYEVLPEGEMDKREFFDFNPETRELIRNEPPKNGFDYISKCISNLTDENGKLKKTGLVAWY